MSSDSRAAELVSRFQALDYVLFSMMLLISAGIGVFFGCFGKKMQTTNDVFMAGRSMSTFPVAMSLIASFMSAITLLGTPSEVYQNGFTYWLIGFSYFLVMPAAAYLYLPAFWNLQVTSAYEYLEKRFCKGVRRMGSCIFITQMCLYMAIVVYAPALALSQVTGLNVYISVSVICVVCTFYTTIGGMKAVLWTDTIQVVIMYSSMVFIIVYGAIDQGGFSEVWAVAAKGNRTNLVDFDPAPTARHTFWTLLFGGYFTWITIYGANQAQIQRYLCVREKYMAIRALWINMIGLFILMIVCAFGGLVIYKKYEGCNPVRTSLIERNDQLFPLFVMDTLGTWPGLPGLFVAGIFSGALSTVSSGMNSLAAICLEDFVKGACCANITEKNATRISKILSMFFGLLTFGLVFVAEQLGSILSAALSIFGIIGGPLLGTFSLGLFVPWANSIGAYIGTALSFFITLFIGAGYQVSVFMKQIKPASLPSETWMCDALNMTVLPPKSDLSHIPPISEQSGLMQLFQISYLWYSAVAFFTTIIVGTLVSFATGPQNLRTLNPYTMSPLVGWMSCIFPQFSEIGMDFPEARTTLHNPRQKNGIANPAFEETSFPMSKLRNL